jgi:hypothetical protein
MESYANQKRYHIEKQIKDGDIFIMVKWEDYTAAANELSPSALKLYMYLAKNQDGYQFWFSPKDYCDIFNLSDKTYRNAKNELMEKGYLKEESNNQVYFSASAAFRESIESLKEKLEKINNILDDDAQDELFNMLDKAKLKEIKNDENLYKAKLKEIVDFAEDLRANQKAMKLKKLL